MKIAILYSLPTKRSQSSSYLVADEDTVVSAKKVADALEEKGATTILIPLSENAIESSIRSIQADFIMNLIDWTGVDLPLSLRAMDALTSSGIPFAGATKENFTLVDKVTMKKALDTVGLPTPRWQVFQTGNEAISDDLVYPVLVKLAKEHCSVGIEKSSYVLDKGSLRSVVKDRIARFGMDVYAEEFVRGREFQITVLEKEEGPVMLHPAEIMYKPSDSPEFLTFTERWDEKNPEYQRSDTALAKLSEKELHQFKEISVRAFQLLGFHDFTRVDARLKNNTELLILEVNPNPGLDDDELYSMTISARSAGLTFPDFLWAIVTSALRRARKG
jgi:D-alanine-D-alanine ligase